MPDPYHLSEVRAQAAPPAHSPAERPPTSPLRTLLWVLLALSVAGSSLASLGVVPPALSLVFGVLTAICVTGLVAMHVRRR